MQNRQQLITAINQGFTPKYLFFWGHTPSPTGEITKSCLSQWYESAFVLDGVNYPTAEHYMMASKAKLFNDHESLANILASQTPAEAKKLGRAVKNFDGEIWQRHAFDIVVQANIAKFSQNPELKAFLQTTGERILVEASPLDTIWGIGLGQDNPKAQDPQTWHGENLLGFALMQARSMMLQTNNL